MQAQVPTVAPSRRAALLLLIGILPFSDFLQIGVFAFCAAPVMGDLGASPEEYSLLATLYAVTAIGMIYLHRWGVERLGWHWFMRGASLLYAAGSLLCAISDTLTQFALGRFVTALGCASFLTAGRVLVNLIPPSPKRFTGVKFFASGIAWGGVCAPLLASAALAWWDWRWAFAAQLLPAGLMALLGELSLPRTPLAVRAPFDTHGLMALMGGSALVLFALQRSAFIYFSEGTQVYAFAALGALVLLAAGRLIARRDRPFLRLGAMSQPRFLVGIAAFSTCYAILGANNTAIPQMLMRGLNLPLEVIARDIGIAALAGVLIWIVLSRLLPRHQGPTRYYVLALGLLAAACLQFARLSEGADPQSSVLPALICSSAFVIAALSTTALQTFRDLQRDDTVFSHANQVKNVFGQIGVAAGMCLATVFIQWRTAVHYVHVGEAWGPGSLALEDALRVLGQRYGASADPVSAGRMALATLNGLLQQEAAFLALLDYFRAMSCVAALCLLAVLVERVVRLRRSRRARGLP